MPSNADLFAIAQRANPHWDPEQIWRWIEQQRKDNLRRKMQIKADAAAQPSFFSQPKKASE
jgi:hypothetical protein